jgi:hypothetical protein
MSDELLMAMQAAKLLGVSRRSFNRLRLRFYITASRRAPRWKRSDIELYLQSKREVPAIGAGGAAGAAHAAVVA